jgi:hypothetical protein
MIDFFTIGGFGITLLFGLASIPLLRMHFRTGLKGLLFMGVGVILMAFGALGITILERKLAPLHEGDSLYDSIFLLFMIVIGVAYLITLLGVIILYTRESGFYLEFLEKTTFRQKLTGNIPILKFEKPPPPAINKRTGLICGITAITFGSLLILLHILFKIPGFTIHFVISGSFALIIGLLLVIFSMIYLDKGKKSPE